MILLMLTDTDKAVRQAVAEGVRAPA